MRLETYKMASSILLKFQTLKCDISRTIWRIEVSDGSLFCIFHALSFERNLFFDRTCPLKLNTNYDAKVMKGTCGAFVEVVLFSGLLHTLRLFWKTLTYKQMHVIQKLFGIF